MTATASAAAQLKFTKQKSKFLQAGRNFGLVPKWLYRLKFYPDIILFQDLQRFVGPSVHRSVRPLVRCCLRGARDLWRLALFIFFPLQSLFHNHLFAIFLSQSFICYLFFNLGKTLDALLSARGFVFIDTEFFQLSLGLHMGKPVFSLKCA